MTHGSATRTRWGTVLVVAMFFVLTSARDAQAYIDPGAVSLLFQGMVAALLGSLFILRRQAAQLAAKMKALFSSSKQEDDED
jgi:hypothetical protein